MKGFHLIEILITLTILMILLAVSIPTYSHYLVCEKRLEAEAALGKLAILMEHYHIEYNTYQGATLTELKMPQHIAKDNYQLIIQSVNDNDYLISAIPLGDQAEKDDACRTLTLNSLGQKRISGSGNLNECW